MIHNLYIVRPNGVCIFHEKYGSLEEDPQSIAGFLTAISMFSKAVIGDDVKFIATNNYKFIFKKDSKFTFVIFVDQSDKFDVAQRWLDEIKNLFYKRFPRAESECKSGNLKLFENFKSDLANIFN